MENLCLYRRKEKGASGKDESDLFNKLYDHYSMIDNASKTLISVFEQLCSYKKCIMMRSQNTIDDDRSFFSNLSVKLQTSLIQDIVEDDIRDWIRMIIYISIVNSFEKLILTQRKLRYMRCLTLKMNVLIHMMGDTFHLPTKQKL